MKITFYSNFMNHHQLEFCNYLYENLGDNFTFVATEKLPQERVELGYEELNDKCKYVLKEYLSKENKTLAMELALDSDVVIHGSASELYVCERMKLNKLTFRYTERLYKRGRWRAFTPKNMIYMFKNHFKYLNKPLYVLCASAYAASDFSLTKCYKNKLFKWGYFPKFISHDIDKLMLSKLSGKINILWCGRFLEWKHPEKMILLAKKLLSRGYDFHINMIGTGKLYKDIKQAIEKNGLSENISLLGSMSPLRVREYMEVSNIYLFTSNYEEGWGAVLNEAMNSCCAVVASHAIGSVPFLINHGINGLIYNNDNNEDMFAQVERFLLDKELRHKCSINSYYTIKNIWNAKHSALAFLKLSNNLLKNNLNEITNGPCSKANSISQSNMYAHVINHEL